MTTRLTVRLGAVALTLAFAATPALAMSKRTGHHTETSNSSSDHMADELNSQSLAASRSGSSFTPGGGGMNSTEPMNAPSNAPMNAPSNPPTGHSM